MPLCKKIRLRVSTADAAALEFMQGKCRGLFNWWVLRLRDGELWPGWAEAKATLESSKRHDPDLRIVYSTLWHEVYFRLDNAMAGFFRRVKAGETPGFPRVRPRHAFFTSCDPAMYIKMAGDHLYLPTGAGGDHRHCYTVSQHRRTPHRTGSDSVPGGGDLAGRARPLLRLVCRRATR